MLHHISYACHSNGGESFTMGCIESGILSRVCGKVADEEKVNPGTKLLPDEI